MKKETKKNETKKKETKNKTSVNKASMKKETKKKETKKKTSVNKTSKKKETKKKTSVNKASMKKETKKNETKDKKKSNLLNKIEFRIKYDAAKDDVVGVPIELLNKNLSKIALQLVNKEEIVISKNKIKIAAKFKEHSNITSLCKKNGFTRFDLLKYILIIYKKEYGSNLHDKIITGLKLKGDVYWIGEDS